MYTNDFYEILAKTNLIITYIENALLAEDRIVNFTLEDKGYEMVFGFKKDGYVQPLTIIRKASETSLNDVYEALMSHFEACTELGSTMEYKDKQVIFNLAPVFADKVLLEIISPKAEDQKWFYEELVKSTQTEKGLK